MSGETESERLAIGELLTGTDEPVVRKVLGSYSSAASHAINTEQIKSHTARPVEACATYLGLENLRDTDDKKLYKNLTILSEWVVLRIESHFELQCQDCDVTYRNPFGERPLLRCLLCFQGSHNCNKMKDRAEAFTDLQNRGLMPAGEWRSLVLFFVSPQERYGAASKDRQGPET